jgi:hypothetical protein
VLFQEIDLALTQKLHEEFDKEDYCNHIIGIKKIPKCLLFLSSPLKAKYYH